MGRICATLCGKRNGALGRAGRTNPDISALRSSFSARIQAERCHFRPESCSLHVRSCGAKALRAWAARGALATTAGCQNLSAAVRIWSCLSPKSFLTRRPSHTNPERGHTIDARAPALRACPATCARLRSRAPGLRRRHPGGQSRSDMFFRSPGLAPMCNTTPDHA